MKNKFLAQFGKRISIETLMSDELYEAEKALLDAQTGLEWAQSQVEYNTNRVARLKKQIAANRILEESKAKTVEKAVSQLITK